MTPRPNVPRREPMGAKGEGQSEEEKENQDKPDDPLPHDMVTHALPWTSTLMRCQ